MWVKSNTSTSSNNLFNLLENTIFVVSWVWWKEVDLNDIEGCYHLPVSRYRQGDIIKSDC